MKNSFFLFSKKPMFFLPTIRQLGHKELGIKISPTWNSLFKYSYSTNKNTNNASVFGYKLFCENFVINPKRSSNEPSQLEYPFKWNKVERPIQLTSNGFYFSNTPLKCLEYFFDYELKQILTRVECKGEMVHSELGEKSACEEIRVVKVFSDEQRKILLTGKLVASTNIIYHYVDGLLHCENGPAVIIKPGVNEEWWKNGEPHREDGPAIIRETFQAWYIHGRKHRDNDPATIYFDGKMEQK